jgi:Spy/CpxP family protein refolding chaperone
MKNRFKFIALCLSLAMVAVPMVKAQSESKDAANPPRERGPGGPGGRGPNFEKIAEELGLTADQKAKAEPIFKEQAKKMQGMRDLPPDERREKMKAMREENHKALAEILTPEQLKKFDEMRPRGGDRPPRGEKGEKGEKPADK